MNIENTDSTSADTRLKQLEGKFKDALTRLSEARPFAKGRYRQQVLDLSRRIMGTPEGVLLLYEHVQRMDEGGIFNDTDWMYPGSLLPNLVRMTLESGDKTTIVLDMLSHLRMLALAKRRFFHPGISPEGAHHFLTQVLALNLDRLFGSGSEAQRERLGALSDAVDTLFGFLLEHIGFEDILSNLIDEIWRMLSQRPIQVNSIKAMITQISVALPQEGASFSDSRLGADRLISALYGPTKGCLDDPGIALYQERLGAMDFQALQQEAYGFARAMHDTGLVSDYHALFLRWLLENEQAQLLPDALGLSSTGLDNLRSYQELVHTLIKEAIHPQTAQAVYGLAMMLERGILYSPPIAPALWRQIGLELSELANINLGMAYGSALPPRVHLLAGVILLLGLPLGIGQGNNPTCQSARAIAMWSYNDPDFLLHLIAQAASIDGIIMHFEGKRIISGALETGLSPYVPLDTDPVSVILVPQLDRVYAEMGRICAERVGDPHRWINPEFHGWWVGREFFIAVNVTTGELESYREFLQRFYSSYHPFYNGNRPVIHPQPAGIAVTDSTARFIGWHAITLIRVALDQEDVMRIYFYNPNNDSGQNWGNGVVVSTQGHGERPGEASLPFEQLLSRLYIFHDEPIVHALEHTAREDELQRVEQMARESWAQDRYTPQSVAASGTGRI